MKKFIYGIIVIVVLGIASCSKSNSQLNLDLDKAEKIVQTDTESAMTILEAIDPLTLRVDSLKAKYIYLKAYSHMLCNRPMIGDSLIRFAHNYYRGKNLARETRSGIALAWYKFWDDDISGARAILDSITELPNMPDSLMVQALRTSVIVTAYENQNRNLISLAKRLYNLETDSLRKMEAKYMILVGYEYSGQIVSAINIIDELINYSRNHDLGEKHFSLEIEKAQLLTEAGRNAESDALIGEIFRKAGQNNGASDILHFQYAINALNSGDTNRALRHIVLADNFAIKLRGKNDDDFRNYSNLIHAIIDFEHTGSIKLRHINKLNNQKSEHFSRMKASQLDSERSALQQQNRVLALKAESEHKTVIILLICIITLTALAITCWIIITRRQREHEQEDRIETLQKMVDEYKSTPPARESETIDSSTLRNAMLRQLDIIKMVAETPTEQNREMLRKISSIGGDTKGELVDWKNVFEMIDNLYSGFYGNLHQLYGDLLTLKEEQIIVLMLAGFSTKEISVITGQTTSTIYVRKSSIRKKLKVPEKEDILVYLRNDSKL